MVSGLHPRRVDTPMAPATAAAPAILPKCRTARCARARRAMRVQALPQNDAPRPADWGTAVSLGQRVAPTEQLNKHVPEVKPRRRLVNTCNRTLDRRFQSLMRDVGAMTPSWPHGTANCDGRDAARPSILFGVVSSAKRLEYARQLLLSNLRAIGEWGGVSAKFVLYTFDSSCARWGPIGADARAAAGAALLSFSCEDAGNATLNTIQQVPYVPKSLLLVRLVQHLRGHQVVWTLDDDISLARLAFWPFWRIRSCLDAVIVQPVIAGRRQAYWIANGRSWYDHLRLSAPPANRSAMPTGLLALQTTLVEMQAPLFDTAFFAHLVENGWRKVAAFQAEKRTQVGIDLVWCAAAARFVRRRRPACAVIATPVEHANYGSVKKTDPRTRAFTDPYLAMKSVLEYVRDTFGPDLVSNKSLYRASSEVVALRRQHRCFAQRAGIGKVLPWPSDGAGFVD
jgi:hypothetical protein